ncbi:diaminopimelate epimerase [Desulforhopalus singaporensis]|uniref:Diaminopimelate epimerase n=1 Tax=Desulforhopalus singaporensis TaxID=91360 RepID=A0A1H0TTV9_9BACT|nr:diaminopimelate epimerase [Desulforhopalus singaporensis]SDP57477.1 diaminopimelate epimerase [Desulforhopalus singaporensis]
MVLDFPIAFEKMSGTGNDFVIIDNREGLIPLEQHPELAKKVCQRKFSVGADGLILLKNSDKADIGWDFYNADGSVAEMCGNGSRCAAKFAHSHGIAGKKMKLETIAGVVEMEICNGDQAVRVKMPQPFDFRVGLSISLDDVEYPVTYVNTGVPQAVIFVSEDNVPVKKWGRKVRFHQLFEPKGTNANFVQVLDKGLLKVRTYERGVEDETMACGTGAVAAALISAMQKDMDSPIEVITSGGERLTILFDLQDGPVADNVFLQGPAKLIYTGELTGEALL